MSLPEGFLSTTLSYMAIGAGLGGAYGVWKSYSGNGQELVDSDSQYPNIKYDEFAQDAVNKLRTYQRYDPESFDNILFNIDRMIGLQISVNEEKINASFPHKATRYYMNIDRELKNLKYATRNTSVPGFQTDSDTLLQMMDDYRNNITLDTNTYLLSHRSVDYAPPKY